MTTYSREVERQRREIRGVLIDALRARNEIIEDIQLDEGFVLHPYKDGQPPYLTDAQGHTYRLIAGGRLKINKN